MEHIALRAFPCGKDSISKPKSGKIYENLNFPRVLTFDTETTDDEFLNLKFGSFMVHESDIFHYGGLFWDNRHVSEEEYKILKKQAEKKT